MGMAYLFLEPSIDAGRFPREKNHWANFGWYRQNCRRQELCPIYEPFGSMATKEQFGCILNHHTSREYRS